MFTCWFKVLLFEGRTTVELRRTIVMPFVPFTGLEMVGIAEGPVVVAYVAWNATQNVVEVELADETAEGFPLADLVKSYGPEWEVVGDK